MMNKTWTDRADKDLFFTILSVKSIGIISGSEWTTIGNTLRAMGYGFTNEGCRQHFQGLRRAQQKETGGVLPEFQARNPTDPTANPITRRPGPGRPRKQPTPAAPLPEVSAGPPVPQNSTTTITNTNTTSNITTSKDSNTDTSTNTNSNTNPNNDNNVNTHSNVSTNTNTNTNSNANTNANNDNNNNNNNTNNTTQNVAQHNPHHQQQQQQQLHPPPPRHQVPIPPTPTNPPVTAPNNPFHPFHNQRSRRQVAIQPLPKNKRPVAPPILPRRHVQILPKPPANASAYALNHPAHLSHTSYPGSPSSNSHSPSQPHHQPQPPPAIDITTSSPYIPQDLFPSPSSRSASISNLPQSAVLPQQISSSNIPTSTTPIFISPTPEAVSSPHRSPSLDPEPQPSQENTAVVSATQDSPHDQEQPQAKRIKLEQEEEHPVLLAANQTNGDEAVLALAAHSNSDTVGSDGPSQSLR